MGYRDKREEEFTPTKFNAAIASLESLRQLLNDCNEYSRLAHANGYNFEYLKQWKYTVTDILKELSPKLSVNEKKDIKKKFGMFKYITDNYGPIMVSVKTPDGPIKELNVKTFKKYWSLIHNIETYLRLCADKRNMLMPDKDDDFMEPEHF